MDGSASNRMYQNLVVRGRCLKNKIQTGDYDFYYANSHQGLMINKKLTKLQLELLGLKIFSTNLYYVLFQVLIVLKHHLLFLLLKKLNLLALSDNLTLICENHTLVRDS